VSEIGQTASAVVRRTTTEQRRASALKRIVPLGQGEMRGAPPPTRRVDFHLLGADRRDNFFGDKSGRAKQSQRGGASAQELSVLNVPAPWGNPHGPKDGAASIGRVRLSVCTGRVPTTVRYSLTVARFVRGTRISALAQVSSAKGRLTMTAEFTEDARTLVCDTAVAPAHPDAPSVVVAEPGPSPWRSPARHVSRADGSVARFAGRSGLSTRRPPCSISSRFDEPQKAVLSACKLFSDLGPADRRRLEPAFHVRTAKRGCFFFEQGSPARDLHVLGRGVVKLTRVGRDGRQILLRLVTPPEPFGTVGALTNRTGYAAEAMTDSEALFLRADAFLDIIARHPAVARSALRFLASQLADARERLDDLGARQVSQRVARALLRGIPPTQRRREPSLAITVSLSHQDLADIVGASLYTVSRVLSSWKHLGLVNVKRGRVVVHHLDTLAEMVDAGQEG
jgi:CRP/FNR family transcriptional regulator, nitrogen oxide reductase regulator